MRGIRGRQYICSCVMLMCFILILCVFYENCSAKSKSGKVYTKVLKLEPGNTYNVKYKKKCKYTSSRPKIASISRKGKIKAYKSGRCVIKAIKNKKCIAKYKIMVKTKINNSDNKVNICPNNEVNESAQVDINNTNNMEQDNNKNDNALKPGMYGKNFIVCQRITTLEMLEPIDDSSFYLYFNLDEWYNGTGKLAEYKYLKIRVDRINDKGKYKDIEYYVGNKYIVYIVGNYIIDGDCYLYSEEYGFLGIGEASNN